MQWLLIEFFLYIFVFVQGISKRLCVADVVLYIIVVLHYYLHLYLFSALFSAFTLLSAFIFVIIQTVTFQTSLIQCIHPFFFHTLPTQLVLHTATSATLIDNIFSNNCNSPYTSGNLVITVRSSCSILNIGKPT